MEDTMTAPCDRWDLPVVCTLMPYEDYCEMRGETPDPEFLGRTVQIRDGEATLVPLTPERENGTAT